LHQKFLAPRSKRRPSCRARDPGVGGLAQIVCFFSHISSPSRRAVPIHDWTRYFGPVSGQDAKVDRPRERYALTVFCYGCNLGSTQTARSINDLDRFKLAFVNQRHITEASLNEAIATVVNTYVQFPLQRLWAYEHVKLTLHSLDRIYLNGYVPQVADCGWFDGILFERAQKGDRFPRVAGANDAGFQPGSGGLCPRPEHPGGGLPSGESARTMWLRGCAGKIRDAGR